MNGQSRAAKERPRDAKGRLVSDPTRPYNKAETARRWYAANKERLDALRRLASEQNPEPRRVYNKKYNNSDRGTERAVRRRYRGQGITATPELVALVVAHIKLKRLIKERKKHER